MGECDVDLMWTAKKYFGALCLISTDPLEKRQNYNNLLKFMFYLAV